MGVGCEGLEAAFQDAEAGAALPGEDPVELAGLTEAPGREFR